MKRVILASASPRRKELLGQLGLAFEIVPSRCEEVVTKQAPGEVVEELSLQKAEDAAAQVRGDEKDACDMIVIGSDTIVYHNGRILGKPADREDARKMLRGLQGDTHSVFTGVTVLVWEDGNRSSHTFFSETKVHVCPMTEQETEEYLDIGEPMDKAGAYGIQGKFAAWISGIEGDYNTVVGLPVCALWQVLKQYL